jgi:hypothetical protein
VLKVNIAAYYFFCQAGYIFNETGQQLVVGMGWNSDVGAWN